MDHQPRVGRAPAWRTGRIRAAGCAAALSLALTTLASPVSATVTVPTAAARPVAHAVPRQAVPGPAATAAQAASPAAVRAICAEPSSGATLVIGADKSLAAPPAAAIRVDQVGYPSGAAKLAEIMTTARPAHGMAWVLVRAGSCTVAATG